MHGEVRWLPIISDREWPLLHEIQIIAGVSEQQNDKKNSHAKAEEHVKCLVLDIVFNSPRLRMLKVFIEQMDGFLFFGSRVASELRNLAHTNECKFLRHFEITHHSAELQSRNPKKFLLVSRRDMPEWLSSQRRHAHDTGHVEEIGPC